VSGPQIGGALQEKLGDPARCLGAALGIAMSNDLIKLGDQRCCDCHLTHSKPARRRVLRQFRLAW
jgi:hypothetical protein